MIINNNLMAIMGNQQLERNQKKANGYAKQLSTGEKINSAGDGSSEYAISEKMKISLRALSQCNDNVKKGSTMLGCASAAIDQQLDLAKKIRELAMKASDDTYTNGDREILQAEVSQLLDQSEDIAQATTFNDRALLNQQELGRKDKWFDADAPYRAIPNSTPVLAQAAANGGSYTVPQGAYTVVTSTPVNTYDASAVVPGASLTVLPSINDVVWDNSLGGYGRVIKDPLDNALYVQSGAGKTLIQVQGLANAGYAVAGATNVSVAVYAPVSNPTVGSLVAASATVNFDASTPPNVIAPVKYTVTNSPGSGALSYFVPDSSNSILEIDFSSLFSTLTNVPSDLDGLGFSFACGGCPQFVTIMFDASSAAANRYEGTTRIPHPVCYVLGVQNVTNSNSLMETVFNGITAASDVSGGGNLPSAVDTSTTVTNIHNIKLNYFSSTGKVTISKNGPPITFQNGISGEMKETDYYKPAQKLALQTGEASSQSTNVWLPNTTLSILFPPASKNWDIVPKISDYPEQWPNGYETLSTAQKEAKWREEVWPYPNKTVNLDPDNCLRTRPQAAKFLDQVDQSIKYLLGANTTVGAQIERLQYTNENLDTAMFNQTASESVIRDTNMPAAMMGYVRENMLTQAAQSMLAQANQGSNQVLRLLQ